jgi:site-specific DNA-methyltransferase (adenine-specific)
MNMSRENRARDQKNVDNISPRRYISRMQLNGFYTPPPLSLQYAGPGGLFFQADALDLLANIKSGSIDLAFADPPFNLGKDYQNANFGDDMGPEFYRAWCRTWLLELVRVLRPGGSLFIYHLPKWLIEFGDWLNTIHWVEYKAWIALKMKSGFPVRGRIHPAHYGLLQYAKIGAPATFNVVRTRSPICRHCGELIRDYGGYKDKYKKYELEGAMWVQISDFWEDTRPARQEKTRNKLINELPVQIPERIILLATKPGDVVLDCFAGGGSTLHAAQLHERLWIGCDSGNPDAALARIATFFGTEERPSPQGRLKDCFTAEFLGMIVARNNRQKSRPISKAGKLTRSNVAADKYASKSRVFKPGAEGNGAAPEARLNGGSRAVRGSDRQKPEPRGMGKNGSLRSGRRIPERVRELA